MLDAPPLPPPSVAFLSPFDPLVWDRKLLGSLFVFRDSLVARIEPRIDRDQRRVEVLNVWWEDRFAPGRADGFVDAMRDALHAYLRFAGATRLEGAPHLNKEQRLFLTPFD